MRARPLALLACSVVVLTGCSQEEPAPAPEMDPAPKNYVALGDSYAAMGSRSADTSGPSECLRSTDNYPARVAEALQVEQLDDVTCSGADTSHIHASQIEALQPDTQLVTLSIGGNDIGFGAITGCFLETMRMGTPGNCVDAHKSDIDAQLAALPAKLEAVHNEIMTRSPEATVVVTGYVPIVETGDDCTEIAALSQADRDWAVELTADVNDTVRQAAQNADATFVLPQVEGHSVCATPTQRYVDIYGLETDAYPVHPTPRGQEAMAQAVTQVVTQMGDAQQ